MNYKVCLRWTVSIILWTTLCLVPYLFLGDRTLLNIFIRLIVIGLVLLWVYAGERWRRQKNIMAAVYLLLLGLVVTYSLWHIRQLVWIIIIIACGELLLISRRLAYRTHLFWRVVIVAGAGVFAGAILVLLNAVEIAFAEEEFFFAVTGIYLSLFWLIVFLGYQIVVSKSVLKPIPQRSLHFWIIVTCGGTLLVVLAGLVVLKQYQRSFYPLTAPTYPGITAEAPIMCEQQPQVEASTVLSGEQTERDLLDLLLATPEKSTPIWGSLAIYTQEETYIKSFKESLLQEAQEKRYTQPANSVKWGQFEAARRAYQLEQILKFAPDIFTEDEWQIVLNWFADVNRRAMTVEWVDGLYAAAFGKMPQGPYENQENGAGLLAVLMKNNWAAPELKEANANYLATVPLGWDQLFRNTDDAYFYQGIWQFNAWWINEYRQAVGLSTAEVEKNKEMSFEWLLALALPDGETPNFNVVGEPSAAEYYLLGALTYQNPNLSWLAGKNIRSLIRQGRNIAGYFPFAPLNLVDGQSPDIGSCLVYGDSGVPTAKGPLAPDKVILRNGWADDSAYILTNLRFSGWHRYKATNTTSLIYRNGPIVTENWSGKPFDWLPVGRSAFRDKRVPRENLNGLLVQKSGLSEVLWRLSGIGSKWAQNPPVYAEVEDFFTTDIIDGATTVLTGWDGWTHYRTTYLIDDGTTVIIDNADAGIFAAPASIRWHFSDGVVSDDRIQVNDNTIIWATDADAGTDLEPIDTDRPELNSLRHPGWQLTVSATEKDDLNAGIMITPNNSEANQLALDLLDDGVLFAKWRNPDKVYTLLHNQSGQYRAAETLATDGSMIMFQDDSQGNSILCFNQATKLAVKTIQIANKITFETGEILDARLWQYDGQWLTIALPEGNEDGCVVFR